MKLVLDKVPAGHFCPRCNSHKVYSTENDFFCLTCSLIIVGDAEEYEMHKLHWR